MNIYRLLLFDTIFLLLSDYWFFDNILLFYMKQMLSSTYGNVYTIAVSTNSQTSHADFVPIQTYSEADFSTSYQQFTVDLSSYAGQTIYIAFIMGNDYGDSWYIDDVEVKSGIHNSLAPDEEGIETYNWVWDHDIQNERIIGQHTIKFVVDPQDSITEISD